MRAPSAQARYRRLHDVCWRVEVGLPHSKADDVAHGCGDVEEAPNARGGHRMDTIGKCALCKVAHAAPPPSLARSCGATARHAAVAVSAS